MNGVIAVLTVLWLASNTNGRRVLAIRQDRNSERERERET